LESLDARLAPAVFTWDGGAGTRLFSDAKNWVGDVKPKFDGTDALVFPPEDQLAANNLGLTVVNDFAAEGGLTKFVSVTVMDGYRVSDINQDNDNSNTFLTTQVTDFIRVTSPAGVVFSTNVSMPNATSTFDLMSNSVTVAAYTGEATVAIGGGSLTVGIDSTNVPSSNVGGTVTGVGSLRFEGPVDVDFTGELQLGGSNAFVTVGDFASASPSVRFTGAVAPPAGMPPPNFDVVSGSFLGFSGASFPPDLVVGASSSDARWDFGSATVAGITSAGITISGNSDVIIDGKAKNKIGSKFTEVSGDGQLTVQGASVQTLGEVDLNANGPAVTVVGGTLLLYGGVTPSGFSSDVPSVMLTGGTLGGAGDPFGSNDLRLAATGGVLDPGDPDGDSVDRMRFDTLSVGPGAMVRLQIQGTAANQFDQLAIDESASVDGTLMIEVPAGTTLTPGKAIAIVDSAGSFAPVGGRFAGLAQDATFTDVGVTHGFRIRYNNTTDNTDITLTTIALPVATVALAAGQGATAGGGPLNYVVTFSQPVSGFDAADVRVTAAGLGTPAVAVSPVSPDKNGFATQFQLQLTGLAGAGTVTVAVPNSGVTNADQLPNRDSLPSPAVTVDSLPPVLQITSAVAGTTNAAAIDVFFNFDEAVTGFDAADVAVNGGALANFVAVSATTFRATVTPTADGLVTVTVPTGAGVDAVGNESAPGGFNVTFDRTRPAVAVTSPAGDPTGNAPIPFTLTFGEPVGGLTLDDVIVVNGTAAGLTAVSATQFMLVVTPAAAGPVGVTVRDAAASDAAGNPSTAGALGLTFDPVAVGPRLLLVGFPQFAAGSDRGGGAVTFFDPDRAARFTATPFPGFAGGVRTAAADFNRDGVADVVVGTGPGGVTGVQVLDGVTQKVLFGVQPFEATFTGGVYVAAGDVTGDGVPDLAVTPDEGGGPRVDVFSGGAGFAKVASFFGIDDPNFRGGARASIGDLNGDGVGDLIVAAGFRGGPRVAGFDGTTLAGPRRKLFGDFFAFEQTLRNGIFVAVGDVNGDGFADLVAGGGPRGGPRVLAFDGKSLLSNQYVPLANFFGGDPNSRGGIRLAVKDLDGDAKADLVVGAGTGTGSRVTGYLGKDLVPAGTPPEAFALDAFPGFAGGVFVG
jgi:hypothetical protein